MSTHLIAQLQLMLHMTSALQLLAESMQSHFGREARCRNAMQPHRAAVMRAAAAQVTARNGATEACARCTPHDSRQGGSRLETSGSTLGLRVDDMCAPSADV